MKKLISLLILSLINITSALSLGSSNDNNEPDLQNHNFCEQNSDWSNKTVVSTTVGIGAIIAAFCFLSSRENSPGAIRNDKPQEVALEIKNNITTNSNSKNSGSKTLGVSSEISSAAYEVLDYDSREWRPTSDEFNFFLNGENIKYLSENVYNQINYVGSIENNKNEKGSYYINKYDAVQIKNGESGYFEKGGDSKYCALHRIVDYNGISWRYSRRRSLKVYNKDAIYKLEDAYKKKLKKVSYKLPNGFYKNQNQNQNFGIAEFTAFFDCLYLSRDVNYGNMYEILVVRKKK